MIQVDQLASAIKEALEEYSQEITNVTKISVEQVAKEVNQEIKASVTFQTTNRKNEYVKSFRVKTTEETRFNKTKTWHVANGQHRLTHLLENGHLTKRGDRTQAYPHIRYGEELALRRLPELVEEGIKNAGR